MPPVILPLVQAEPDMEKPPGWGFFHWRFSPDGMMSCRLLPIWKSWNDPGSVVIVSGKAVGSGSLTVNCWVCVESRNGRLPTIRLCGFVLVINVVPTGAIQSSRLPKEADAGQETAAPTMVPVAPGVGVTP